MLFIHHNNDSEREEKPPARIRHVANRLCNNGGPAVANTRGFVSADDPQVGKVMATPNQCGPDFWEIVIEDGDI